jgi:hypothetical protein
MRFNQYYRRSSKSSAKKIYRTRISPRREDAREVSHRKLKQSTNLRKLPHQRRRRTNKKFWYKDESSWRQGISLSLTSNYAEFENNAVRGGGKPEQQDQRKTCNVQVSYLRLYSPRLQICDKCKTI